MPSTAVLEQEVTHQSTTTTRECPALSVEQAFANAGLQIMSAETEAELKLDWERDCLKKAVGARGRWERKNARARCLKSKTGKCLFSLLTALTIGLSFVGVLLAAPSWDFFSIGAVELAFAAAIYWTLAFPSQPSSLAPVDWRWHIGHYNLESGHYNALIANGTAEWECKTHQQHRSAAMRLEAELSRVPGVVHHHVVQSFWTDPIAGVEVIQLGQPIRIYSYLAWRSTRESLTWPAPSSSR